MNVRSLSGVSNKDVGTAMLTSNEVRTRSTTERSEAKGLGVLGKLWSNFLHMPPKNTSFLAEERRTQAAKLCAVAS